jgi:flagellar basal-body rod protein FlgC
MDYQNTFAISSGGMALERARVDVAALNLANANTLHSIDSPGYRPLKVIATAGTNSIAGFNSFMARGMRSAADAPAYPLAPSMRIETASAAPRMVHDPSHPLANARGFVAYPGVDTATEMMTLMSAMRAYEANIAAMNTARSMALKALDIGGQS